MFGNVRRVQFAQIHTRNVPASRPHPRFRDTGFTPLTHLACAEMRESGPVRLASRSLDLLDRVRGSMRAGEDRPGQRDMVDAVARAIGGGEHLVVQAGTGTGKSLAYLIPAVLSGKRVVVATATKALQDQLANKELPFLAEHLDKPLSWAVLKGRSNYLCRQRLDEALAPQSQLGLDGVADAADAAADAARSGAEGRVPLSELKALEAWAAESPTGDRADLTVEPKPWVWSAVSVGPRECPGASKCPRGADCFAEQARSRAAAADVVVVNTHLYGLHLASRAMILPDHDVVIFDEAHEVEDIMSATTGLEVGPGSVTALARTVSTLIADDALIDHLETNAQRLGRQLADLVGSRLRRGVPAEIADTLLAIRERVTEVSNAVRSIDDRANAEVKTRKERVAKAASGLLDDLHQAISPPADTVMWVGGTIEHPKIEMAPLDVGATLEDLLWNPESTGLDFDFGGGAGRWVGEGADVAPDPADHPADDATDDEFGAHDAPASSAGEGTYGIPSTAIFTSATVPDGIVARLQIPPEHVSVIDVGTPFDFAANALLYCATHLPDPRSERYRDAVTDEIERLIAAAGGRTLALFTSHRAMNDAADALEGRIGHRLLRQGDLPKPALIEAFQNDETSCLFATMGFWAGIDVPGDSLRLVTIDKIPFPRPDEPLLQARREKAQAAGFATIDLPRAATMLAQGAGRLIRRTDDRGVVAVLDPRLSTKASYRWQLINALPPMTRTKEFERVAAFLASLD